MYLNLQGSHTVFGHVFHCAGSILQHFGLKNTKDYEVKVQTFSFSSEDVYIHIIFMQSFAIIKNTVQPLQYAFRMIVLY